ncbi:MAG: DUF1302 domain-containing protein [Rhodocyclaceae bacterium]|nr:DUF1302 domain-containing protein [Rhodocyclaceae bacterium]
MSEKIGRKHVRRSLLSLLCCSLGWGQTAAAFEIPVENPDLKVRWDNTVKYSAAYRLHNPSERVAGGASGAPVPGSELDDGDRNFKRGLVSNRVDLFSEFDVAYKNMGLRLSGAAWYDEVYNSGNDNRSATVNSVSVPAGRFTSGTRDMMGRKAELLDAFVYFNSDAMSETPFTVRLGRHSVLYGETLFFGANGIAGTQAPIDTIKLLSVPGSQFKEIIRPVGQVSTQIQLSSSISLGGYYQFEWEKSRLPASGSFLSDLDFFGAGRETVLGWNYAGEDKPDSAQGGLQLRFKPRSGDTEYGFYAARYNEKGPMLMFDPRPFVNQYRLVYPEKIKTVGASFSTVLADVNVSGEVSYRWNAPLVSGPQLDIGFLGNGTNNPLYAVGKTVHLNLSGIYLLGKSALWDGAELLGEIAWNRTLSVDKNPLALDANVTRDATALRMIFTPQYFQVAPGLDLSVPIGIGWNPSGRSSAVEKFNGGVRHGGDVSIGVKGDYQKKWRMALNYTHYFGKEDAFLTPNTVDPAHGPFMRTGAQSLRDRDFISFTVQTTF